MSDLEVRKPQIMSRIASIFALPDTSVGEGCAIGRHMIRELQGNPQEIEHESAHFKAV